MRSATLTITGGVAMSGRLGCIGNLGKAKRLRWELPSRKRGLHAVRDRRRKDIRPLRDSLRTDPNSSGCGRLVAAKESYGFGLEHAALKHASPAFCKDALAGVPNLGGMQGRHDFTTFAGRLGYAMEKSGKSRAELAAVLRSTTGEFGVSPAAIGQVLGGQTRSLTAENCARAARLLGVDSFWLATGEGDPDSGFTPQELATVQQLRDVLRLNPETHEQVVHEIRLLTESLIEAHRQLTTRHGVTAYTTPKRAAEKLKPPTASPTQPDRMLSGNSGFDQLQEIAARKPKPR